MTDAPHRLETPRLVLRQWEARDLEPYADINADPDVMRHLGGPRTAEQVTEDVQRFRRRWQERGFGLYAAELQATGELLGFIGLNVHAAVPTEVEIGWRLARSAWGQGLATEGAAAVRDMAHEALGVAALVSITIPANRRSIRVMEKLDFEFWREQTFEESQLVIYRRDRGPTPVLGGPALR